MLPGLPVNILVFIFGIGDVLRAVEAEIAGKCKADRNSQKIVGHSPIAEELEGKQQGAYGTVCDPAEHRAHADGGAGTGV